MLKSDRRVSRWRGFGVTWLALACSVIALGGEAAPGPTKPALTVVISVDGLSWQTLQRYRPWYTSGLKRLLDEGRVYSEARYQHLNTETSPGHASLSTGAPPRVTGIVGNRWLMPGPDGAIRSVYATQMFVPPPVPGEPPLFYREVVKGDRLLVFAFAREFDAWQSSGEMGKAIVRPGEGPAGQTVIFDSDDAMLLFNQKYGRPTESLPARTALTGPGNLRVDTLGDRLVAADPRSRVVVVSGKDRTSVMLAGHNPRHMAYWFSQETGQFVTSTYYDTFGAVGAMGRTIVARFNRDRAGAKLPMRFGTLWHALPTATPVTGTGVIAPPMPDSALADFQVPTNGLGFPHDLAFGTKGYFTGFYTSPFIDELIIDLAVEFLADQALGLGRGNAPDLLYVGLSAQDVVSHSYGPESLEDLDVMRRVDLSIGRLFDELSRRGLTRGQVVVALAADHGFSTIPEPSRQRDPDYGGGRLVVGDRTFPDFYQRLNRLVSETLCLPAGSKPIFGGEGWSLIYNRPALPMRTVEGACGAADRLVNAKEIDGVLPRVARQFFQEEVASILLVSQRASWPKDDAAVPFAENDFDAERSGDAFIVPKFGVLMHDDPGRGTGHGSHYEYDTHIPLILWGTPWSAGVSSEPVAPYDLAPTLAALFGVQLPSATGRNLGTSVR